MAQLGSIWPNMAQYGSNMLNMAQYGPNMLNMAKYSQILPNTAQIQSNTAQYCPILHTHGLPHTPWPTPYPMGTGTPPHVHPPTTRHEVYRTQSHALEHVHQASFVLKTRGLMHNPVTIFGSRVKSDKIRLCSNRGLQKSAVLTCFHGI